MIGGGPAGASVAWALAARGISTVVLERNGNPVAKPGEVVAPEGRAVLGLLGIENQLDTRSDIARICRGVRATWSGVEELRDDELGALGTGWIVDRARFEDLLASGSRRAGVSWRKESRLLQVGPGRASRWSLRVGTGESPAALEADFLVDASGRPAVVARRCGARRRRTTRLLAGSVTLKPGTLGSYRAGGWVEVEATPDGWWYSAEGPGGLHLAFVGDPCAGSGPPRTAAAWTNAMLGSPRHRDLAPDSDASAFGAARLVDASSSVLDRVAGNGWLAVGDAAAALDPLSGQGLHHAMASGFVAAGAIADHFAGCSDALGVYDHAVRATFVRAERHLTDRYRRHRPWAGEPFWLVHQARSTTSERGADEDQAAASRAASRRDPEARSRSQGRNMPC